MSAMYTGAEIENLNAENNALRAEISLLRQENEILRQRLEHASAGAAVRPKRHVPPPESAADTGSNWRPPAHVSDEAVRFDASMPEAGILRSATLGRPKQVFELAQPDTARSADNAPPLDIGYVNRVGEGELNTLPYGFIVLDSDGEVLFYNETESRLAGFDRNRVIGRNFFQEVAPCTQVKGFQGRFREFVAGKLGKVTFFDFAFHFEKGTQQVTIAFSQGRRPGQVNVMLVRK